MIEFEGWHVPSDFRSDGCTWAPDSWFGNNLKPACIMHDFHRRHAIVSVPDADKIFRRHLIHRGAPAPVARIYWLAVKLTRNFFRKTQALPYEWRAYRYQKAQ